MLSATRDESHSEDFRNVENGYRCSDASRCGRFAFIETGFEIGKTWESFYNLCKLCAAIVCTVVVKLQDCSTIARVFFFFPVIRKSTDESIGAQHVVSMWFMTRR
jgi:hypothetical protein